MNIVRLSVREKSHSHVEADGNGLLKSLFSIFLRTRNSQCTNINQQLTNDSGRRAQTSQKTSRN